MKIVITIIMLILGQVVSAAEPEYLKYRQMFGIKASNLSGYGAFYGFKPTQKVRIQATGIYYLFDRKVMDEHWKITDYTIGMEIQKDIIQEMNYRYYIMAGSYYYHDDDKTESSKFSHVIKDSYNWGAGIGYEYFFRRVTLGLEFGYKFYNDHSKETDGTTGWIPVLERVSKLGAGLNLGFIF